MIRLILLIFVLPCALIGQDNICDPMTSHVENLQANSGSFPAHPSLVFSGQSFKAPAEGATIAGIKVFFSFLREGVTVPLTLYQGLVPPSGGSQLISSYTLLGTGSFTNNTGSNIFPDNNDLLARENGYSVCFEFDSPVDLTADGDYFFLVGTSCDDPQQTCSVGFMAQFDNPYPDGTSLDGSADRVSSFRLQNDLRFSVYSGFCDDEIPSVVANDVTVNVGTTGTTSLTQADINAIAAGTTDNCPNFLSYSISEGQTEYTCADDGRVVRVTLRAMDGCENVATENAIVTINCKDPTPLTLESGNTLTFMDPCSCDDPLNCDEGGITYFHDTLVVMTGGVSGLSITTAPGATDFFIDVSCSGGALTADPGGTLIPEDPIGSGIYRLEFWRPSGSIPTISVIESGMTTAVPMVTFEPACTQEACAATIPTLSQWSIILLALLLTILSVIFIKQRSEDLTVLTD